MLHRALLTGLVICLTLSFSPATPAAETENRKAAPEASWPHNFSLQKLAAKCGKHQWKVVSDSRPIRLGAAGKPLPKQPGFFRSRQIIAKAEIPHRSQSEFADRFGNALWSTLDGSGARKTSAGGTSYVLADRREKPSYVSTQTYTFHRNGKSGHITIQLTGEADSVTLFVTLMEEM